MTAEDEHSPELYRRILAHSSDYVLVVDEMGKVSYASPAIERVMGYSPEEVVGTDAFEHTYPEDRAYAAEAFAETINHPDREVTVEFRGVAKDGSVRWLEARGSSFLADEIVDGVMVNVRDVTDRKHREQRLQVLNRVLRHNLRNDLNAVEGYVELAADVGDRQVQDLLDAALEATDDLLATAETARSVQSSLAETDPHERDLVPVLEEVLDRMREEYPDRELRASLPETVPVVATDDLEDALWELVENACIHGSGPVTVSVDASGGSAVVEIADRGPGIPEHELAILESGEETQLEHASGLGLWVAFWIVRASQGTLAFETDDGTTVRVSLMAPQDE